MTEKLAQQLLQDRAKHAERERARRAAYRRDRTDNIDPFAIANWQIIAGSDSGYMPKIPMRMGKEGFHIACRACGKKFESKGMTYCEPCLALPADERRQMQPEGRECEAPGCSNIIAGTARVDARYCSEACRKRGQRAAKRDKNEGTGPDTVPPQNVPDNGEKTQQNQGSKIEGQKSEAFARLQGDAVLSNWKPSGNGKDCPDIPEFLRRA